MSVKMKLVHTGALRFEAVNEAGKSAWIDGPISLGGTEEGLRPMEMVLAGLAGCSSFDVLHILKKQRQHIERLNIEVEGERADAIPAVFTKIHLRFLATGELDESKLQKAVQLSVEKYCSVATMLMPKVEILYTAEIIPAAH
jgi:putative redox protein